METKKKDVFTFTNNKDITIDYPMKLVEKTVEFTIETERGEPITEYLSFETICLVIKIPAAGSVEIDTSKQPTVFKNETGEILPDTFDYKIDPSVGILKIIPQTTLASASSYENVITVKYQGKIISKKLEFKFRKGYGVNYVRIRPGNEQEHSYVPYHQDVPNKFEGERGLFYKIWIYDKDGNIQEKPFMFFERNAKAFGIISTDYGLYSGPTGLTQLDEKGGFLPKKIGNYEYNIPPVDDVDAAAKLHDMGYDAVDAAGADAASECWACLPADMKLVEDWQKVVDLGEGAADTCNKKKITGGEVSQAKKAIFLFKQYIDKKKKEVAYWMREQHYSITKPNFKQVETGDMDDASSDWDMAAVTYNYEQFRIIYMKQEGQFWVTKNDLDLAKQPFKWVKNTKKKYRYLSKK